MTYHSLRRTQRCCDLSTQGDASIVRQFMQQHGIALANVANLLGGAAASGAVFILMESLRGAVRLTKAQRKQLVRLHRLLTLQDTEGSGRIDALMLADFDPASQEIEDICRLTDALWDLLNRISESPSDLFTIDDAAPSRPRRSHPRKAEAKPAFRRDKHLQPSMGDVA